MLGRTYDDQICSAARALEVVGERWTLLIVRDALFAGARRFSDFQTSLGIATNVLAKRLDGLVRDGVMERRLLDQLRERHEYVLTEMGRDLAKVIVALTEWGDAWASPDGPPKIYRHTTCGAPVSLQLRCPDHGAVQHAEATDSPGRRRRRRRPAPA
jgi:DNA-binding HxlR family transcriptional regulator